MAENPQQQQSPPTDPTPPLKRWLLAAWRELRPILIIIAVLTTLRSAAADWYNVPTGSMKPSILEGDRIFVNKMAYALRFPLTDWRMLEFSGPRRGEIVVFYSPKNHERLVKRVIGLPGETVELRDNHLIIDGRELTYSEAPGDWLSDLAVSDRGGRHILEEQLGGVTHPVIDTPERPSMRNFPPIQVPQNQYLLMGDNRDESADSRFFGFVPRELIAGRALAVLWSMDAEAWYLPRWSRFFKKLP